MNCAIYKLDPFDFTSQFKSAKTLALLLKLPEFPQLTNPTERSWFFYLLFPLVDFNSK